MRPTVACFRRRACSLPPFCAVAILGYVSGHGSPDVVMVQMTQRVGIIGYPLKHSISPAFQQAAFDHRSMDIRYEVWETPPERLPETVTWWRKAGVLGANVTLPHKEQVCAHLDGLSDLARHLGAVNTVVARPEGLVGDNTDAYGFLRALREDGGFQVREKAVLILGAGGVGRTVALALEREGVASITIANRTLERAQRLAAALGPHIGHVEGVPLTRETLATVRERIQWDLIVNCTTVGMRHGPAEGETPLAADLIPREALVYDLVYNPLETPLLREARRAGAHTLGGLPMLVYQGAAAFRLWTEQEAPVDVMFRAAQAALDGCFLN